MELRIIRTILVGAFFLLLSILFISAITRAESVTLGWDANVPAPDGYKIFQRVVKTVAGETVADSQYDYDAPAWTGPGTIGSVGDLTPGARYAFVVRAYTGSLESADSNQVFYTIPVEGEDKEYPEQASNVRVAADLDGDGDVDGNDLRIFAPQMGAGAD